MSFVERIAELNTGRLDGLHPFILDGAALGWLAEASAARLAAYKGVFKFDQHGLQLDDRLLPANLGERSDAVAPVLADLARRGYLSGWRNELFPIVARLGHPPSLLVERAAVAMFGARGFGVHINGFVRTDDGIAMWVAKRADDKPTWPGLLDQIVAGGQPAGLGVRENVTKECWEEAGIDAALASRAQAAGAVSYCMQTDVGLRPDWLFVFDLELPADFTPFNTDGEVAAFELWPLSEVADAVASTRAFKPNCALVIIDFLVRHGFVDSANQDFEAIVTGLHHRDASRYGTLC
jgi:8-oxo-dGTP pyrophosphatase MutT (NUDIX family)